MEDMLLLLTYFIIYSFIGWALESTYKSILQKKLVNSGFLNGPLCPIYGTGAIIMYLSLKDLTDNIVILFLYGVIVLSIFEYIVGLFLEIVFKTKYWDYSSKKFNIHGRVCLQNSLYWGVLGIIFIRLIHPLIERVIKKVPIKYLVISVVIIIIGIIADTIVTIIQLIRINIKLKNWESITERITRRIENARIKQEETLNRLRSINLKPASEFLERFVKVKSKDEVLQELKEKQHMLQDKLERRIARLRRAFPTMRSERLSKFFNNMKKS